MRNPAAGRAGELWGQRGASSCLLMLSSSLGSPSTIQKCCQCQLGAPARSSGVSAKGKQAEAVVSPMSWAWGCARAGAVGGCPHGFLPLGGSCAATAPLPSARCLWGQQEGASTEAESCSEPVAAQFTASTATGAAPAPRDSPWLGSAEHRGRDSRSKFSLMKRLCSSVQTFSCQQRWLLLRLLPPGAPCLSLPSRLQHPPALRAGTGGAERCRTPG